VLSGEWAEANRARSQRRPPKPPRAVDDVILALGRPDKRIRLDRRGAPAVLEGDFPQPRAHAGAIDALARCAPCLHSITVNGRRAARVAHEAFADALAAAAQSLFASRKARASICASGSCARPENGKGEQKAPRPI